MPESTRSNKASSSSNSAYSKSVIAATSVRVDIERRVGVERQRQKRVARGERRRREVVGGGGGIDAGERAGQPPGVRRRLDRAALVRRELAGARHALDPGMQAGAGRFAVVERDDRRAGTESAPERVAGAVERRVRFFEQRQRLELVERHLRPGAPVALPGIVSARGVQQLVIRAARMGLGHVLAERKRFGRGRSAKDQGPRGRWHRDLGARATASVRAVFAVAAPPTGTLACDGGSRARAQAIVKARSTRLEPERTSRPQTTRSACAVARRECSALPIA